MATRTERVVLEYESGITTGAAKDAAAIALLKRELGGLGGSNAKASTSTQKLGTDLEATGRKADVGGKSIDRYSGRLGLLVSGLSAVGPAAVPIGAAVVPAVTALGSGLGFAAAGAGTLALAFNGVGDALTKVNKAALEPTDSNLQAAHLAMSQLSPDAREFVRELHNLVPAFQAVRAAAGQDLFGGLTDGLRFARQDAPLIERALRNIGAELGDLGREAGQSLASDRWRPFLRFIGTEAPRELNVLSHAAGDVTHGLAELWMAFTPLNQDLDQGILRLADDFDRWATSLGRTKDFQAFVAYIQTNGPRVVDLLGDIGQLFVDIVQAAAPLGGPTLQTLDTIVKLLDLIANSPIATPLLALAQLSAALKLTSRGLGALGLEAKVGLGGVTAGATRGQSALRGLTTEAREAAAAVRSIGGNVGKNAAIGTPLLTGVSGEGKAALAKAGLLAGGVALAASGADQKLGLTNTATLALAGSMAGPLGAAIGGTVGGFLDLQAQLDKDHASTVAFDAAIDALASQDKVAKLQRISDRLHAVGDTGGLVGDLANQMSQKVDPALQKTQSRLDSLTGHQLLAAQAAGKFGREQKEAAKKTLAMQQAAQQTTDQFRQFGTNLNDNKVSLDDWLRSLEKQNQALREFADNAVKAANRGLRDGLIRQLEAAGPEGALRLKQLANASESEIGRANRAWDSGKRAADDYQNAVAYISKHPPSLRVNGGDKTLQELLDIQSALAQLRHMQNTTLTVRTTGGRTLPGLADGGLVPGPRAPYGDKVLAALAPGEFVVSDRHGQASQNRALLESINARRYADGGTVAASRASGRSSWGSSAQPAAMQIDYPRLAAALAAVRPLYGDVKISGDPTAFRQQMQQDAAMAAMSGVSRG